MIGYNNDCMLLLVPEVSAFGGKGREKLVNGTSMLQVPPGYKKLEATFLPLACLPLKHAQIGHHRFSSS